MTAPGATGSRSGIERPLLEVTDLAVHFPVRSGAWQKSPVVVRAVDGVSFELRRGETLGLVGESGCGKSTTGRALLRLVEPTAGSVRFAGEDVLAMGRSALRAFRRRAQIIFQDPFSSLNPRSSVGHMLDESLRVHGLAGDRRSRKERVRELLDLVGLLPEHADRFPHEFSGGQRQRIGIARALSVEPELIVCDEPVSALDVSVQAQVINLLDSLKRELGLTYLFIAHDLSVIEHVSDRVAVMYLGRIVELVEAETLYRSPLHPYSQALLAAVPKLDPAQRHAPVVLSGDVPSPVDPPSGCPFHPRCPSPDKDDICRRDEPRLQEKSSGHVVSCHKA